MIRIWLVLAVLATGRIAHAQIYLDPEPDPQHATALALEGTALSVAAIGGGIVLVSNIRYSEEGILAIGLGAGSLIITPSLGHRYGTGNARTPGMLVRIGGYATIGAGALLEVADNLHFCLEDTDCPPPNHRGLAVMGVGGAIMLLGAIYDIATAARDTEAAVQQRRAFLHIAPTAMRTSDGRTITGLAVGGRF
jgi:hypothetical protein